MSILGEEKKMCSIKENKIYFKRIEFFGKKNKLKLKMKSIKYQTKGCKKTFTATKMDILNYDKETKDICNFLPGILKNQPFGAFFIINQKLQVSQKFKSMI